MSLASSEQAATALNLRQSQTSFLEHRGEKLLVKRLMDHTSKRLAFALFAIGLLTIVGLATFQQIRCYTNSVGRTCTNEFSSYSLYEIDINLGISEFEQLSRSPRDNVVGEIRINRGDKVAAKIHLKGNATFEHIGKRPNFSIKLSSAGIERAAPLPWRKFKLHNSKQDPSLLRDALGRRIFRDLEIPAPLLAYALVKLNEKSLGFYTLSEDQSKEFLRRNFVSEEGPLLEGEFHDVDELLMDYDATGGKTEGEGLSPAFSPIAFNTNSLWQFFLSEYVTAHEDGYVVNQNNYWMYRDPGTGRWCLFPHTLDSVFRSHGALLRMKANGQLIREALASADARAHFQALAFEALSPAKTTRWRNYLEFQGSNLLRDVTHTAPRQAEAICLGLKQLEAVFDAHISELRSAWEIGRDRMDFSPELSLPQSWKMLGGMGKAQMKAREGIHPEIVISNEDAENTVYIGCYFFCRPGAYTLVTPAYAELGENTIHESAEIEISIRKEQARTFRIATTGHQSLEYHFRVDSVSADIPFFADRIKLIVGMRHCRGNIRLDLAELLLTRTGE